MSPGDAGSLASAAASFLALAISLVTLRRTDRFNDRQNELANTTERLNQLLIDKETAEGHSSKRADVSANLIQVGKSNYRLKVFNRGRGTAKNVRIADLGGEDTVLLANDVNIKFPVPIMESQQGVELIASIHYNSPLRAHVLLTWDDETGSDHSKELTPGL